MSKLTPYLSNKLFERLSILPGARDSLIKEANAMSGIGINSEDDHKVFFYILRHSKKISTELSKRSLSPEEISTLSTIIFDNRRKHPINTIFNFYKAAEIALNKMSIPIKKMAYPQGDGFGFTENPHNVEKWIQAMRDIYALAQKPEHELGSAFEVITANWDKMERKDFKHWMSFYEENAQNKYKTAEYYEAGPGTMIPMDHLRAKLPSNPDMSQFNHAQVQVQQADLELKKKEEIKKKLKAIISRLNSAERLATDPEVQKDLQQCLDVGVPKWLEELQRVKRLIQLAPMRSSSSTILEDIIVRQSNILSKQGFPKTARELRKFAQAPIPVPPEGPMDGDNTGNSNGDQALDELVEGMNLDNDEADSNDIEDVEDDPLAGITIIAQAVPVEPVPQPQAVPAPLEISEPTEATAAQTALDVKTDDLFDAALSNVTIKDVVLRLETLANLFRTREIPRQLAIIDLMMDKLNISAFFPSLAEASSKSLESNQYALTRVEDILSKLRGSIETPKHMELELTNENNATPSKPLPAEINNDAVRQGLAQQEEADKNRKERRKAEENAEATQAISPQAPAAEAVTNVPEELAQPANIVGPKPQIG